LTPDPRDNLLGLDARERAVLVAIYEHKILLTEPLKAMFFASLRRAQDRLRHLAQRGLIDTWYPPQPRGMAKASGHHTLTESGARVVASLLGIARSELRYVVRDEYDREQDSYLAHRLGVNEFFCALIEGGRANDGHGLAKWVPERTVEQTPAKARRSSQPAREVGVVGGSGARGPGKPGDVRQGEPHGH
jgi:hypothetical protein